MIETLKSYTEAEAVKNWSVLGVNILETKKATAEPKFATFDNVTKTFKDILGFTIKKDNGKSIYIDLDFLTLKNGTKCILPSSECVTAWCSLKMKCYFIFIDEKNKSIIFFA